MSSGVEARDAAQYPTAHRPGLQPRTKVQMLVAQSYLTLCDCGMPGRNTGVGCHFLTPGDLPGPGIEAGSPALQADSLPSEPSGKPQE